MPVSKKIIDDCKTKLLELRSNLIERIQEERMLHSQRETGGDEADFSAGLVAENEFLASQERLKVQLIEVDYALARIESGKFGVCEETQEPIEEARLLAIPWTRLSIEGAEIREEMSKRYRRA